MPKPQSAASHASTDPTFLGAGLILLANFVLALVYTVHQWPRHSRSHLWWIVLSIAFIIMLLRTRRYATQNQDRIIRLEERIRYLSLLTPADQAAAQSLTLPQVIALRFASDPELPPLLRRTLAESLTPKQIKQSITTWRPDHQRV